MINAVTSRGAVALPVRGGRERSSCRVTDNSCVGSVTRFNTYYHSYIYHDSPIIKANENGTKLKRSEQN